MHTLELRQERAKLVTQARELNDTTITEKRDFTGEEREKYDKIMADVRSLADRITRAEELDGLKSAEERSILNAKTEEELKRAEESLMHKAPKKDKDAKQTPEARAFENYLRAGIEGLSQEDRSLMLNRRSEERALTTATGSSGGFTVDQQFRAVMTEARLFIGGVALAPVQVINTAGGNPIPMPLTNDTSNEGEIIAENTAANTQDPVFSQVTIGAFKYSSKTVLVPYELLQDSAIDIAALVARLLGLRVARIYNRHQTVGTNSGQPQGVVPASAVGRTGPTGQTTSITADDIKFLKRSVDPSYRNPNARFMANDATFGVIERLKDAENRYLWQPAISAGQLDTLEGYPAIPNQNMAVMAASARSLLFGDFSNVLVRNAMDITLYRVVDKYIESGQVGFLTWSRMDQKVLDAGTNPIKCYVNSAS
jgi:HK97 family phage major capsid protein